MIHFKYIVKKIIKQILYGFLFNITLTHCVYIYVYKYVYNPIYLYFQCSILDNYIKFYIIMIIWKSDISIEKQTKGKGLQLYLSCLTNNVQPKNIQLIVEALTIQIWKCNLSFLLF